MRSSTSERPLSAKTLSEEIDASLPTIYRRIEWLLESVLIEEQPAFPEQGRHYGVFQARLEPIAIHLEDGELTVIVESEPTDPALLAALFVEATLSGVVFVVRTAVFAVAYRDLSSDEFIRGGRIGS